MFRDIVGLLKKYNVEYWLDFGTLLGAVRNGEAMPWDGDFDLSSFETNKVINETFEEELESLGYKMEVTESNIKFVACDWSFGFYVLDLHRYVLTEDGYGYYGYGEEITSKFSKKLNSLNEHISSYIVGGAGYERKYPSYDLLCRALIQSGVDRTDIYSHTNVKIELSKRNGKSYFRLTSKGQTFDNTPETRVGVVKRNKGKLETYLPLHRAPRGVLKLLSSLCQPWLRRAKRRCAKEVFFPEEYFINMENIDLYGVLHKAPSPKEEYLERIYGSDWRTPVVTHNKDYLNRLVRQ